LLAVLVFVGGLRAAETIPSAPQDHFNDYAGIVERAAAQRLNAELAQFERETSNQIVVAVYPRMESDSSVEDYTVRVAQAWGVGTKGKSNGAVLFVFQQSHDIRIVTGYGLEGALPDALCKRIIEDEIIPRFRRSDFTGGLSAGVHAMMAAARGEYTGTGRTAREMSRRATGVPIGAVFFAIVVAMMVLSGVLRRRRNFFYSPRGRRGVWINPRGPWGGGFGGGGGGTFSGGGGSFGGGGAGGKW
jgi:uncharacterized protein